MAVESIGRFFSPVEIQYGQSVLVAGIGLLVNIACALLLHDSHGHHHHHGHTYCEDNDHHHEDHNLKAAYFHVLADALTSVLAIVALLFGRTLGWWALDPLMGIVGALVITRWAWGLLKESGAILLDASVDGGVRDKIQSAIEEDGDNRSRICISGKSDLTIWQLSSPW